MFSKYPGVELALSVECQQNLQPFYTATEHAFQGISPVITAFSQIFLVSLAQRWDKHTWLTAFTESKGKENFRSLFYAASS